MTTLHTDDRAALRRYRRQWAWYWVRAFGPALCCPAAATAAMPHGSVVAFVTGVLAVVSGVLLDALIFVPPARRQVAVDVRQAAFAGVLLSALSVVHWSRGLIAGALLVVLGHSWTVQNGDPYRVLPVYGNRGRRP